jgi:hypothetical protein
MKSRASHHPYRTLCSAIACLLTLSSEQTATGRAAQDQSPNSLEKCPTISVSCPSKLDYEKSLTFTALVNGIAPETIRYDWKVSAGTILEGQGTATIKVDTSTIGGQAITGTVTIYGLPKSCHTQASCSLAPVDAPSPAVLFDRYYPKSIGAAVPKRTHRRRKTTRLH